MSAAPDELPPNRIESSHGPLRGPLVRFALFAAVIAAVAALLLATPVADYLEREALTALLGELRLAWWAPLALMASFVVVSASGIPISPLIFAGGAVFGPLWGWLYNVVGSLLGAVASYLLATALGKQLIERLAGESRMRRIEGMLERHGFWTLVGIRFLPIPFALINYGSALSGFRFGPFLGATLLGLVPSIFMWTYLAHTLVSVATEERSAALRNVAVMVVVAAALVLLRPLGRRLLRRNGQLAATPAEPPPPQPPRLG